MEGNTVKKCLKSIKSLETHLQKSQNLVNGYEKSYESLRVACRRNEFFRRTRDTDLESLHLHGKARMEEGGLFIFGWDAEERFVK